MNPLMKRSTLAIISAAVILAAGGLLLYFLLIARRPSVPPPTAPAAPAAPKLSDNFYSAVNLYMAGPATVGGNTDRLELTMTKASVKRKDDGKEFEIYDGAVRVLVQKNLAQKVLNALLPAGHEDSLTLTFSPTGQLISKNGSTTLVYLPKKTLTIGLDADLPSSRSLVAIFDLGIDGRFGAQNGLPTYSFPDRVKASSSVLGGVYFNTRSVGKVFELPDATLIKAVKADLGIDITPVPGRNGSPGYAPPNSATKPPVNP